MRWTLDMDADLGLYTINDGEGEFARVTAVRDDHNRASLIAAAPDLLEALTEMRVEVRALVNTLALATERATRHLYDLDSLAQAAEPRMSRALRATEAAIAKAAGGASA